VVRTPGTHPLPCSLNDRRQHPAYWLTARFRYAGETETLLLRDQLRPAFEI